MRASSLFVLAIEQIESGETIPIGGLFKISLEAAVGLTVFFVCCLILIHMATWLSRYERTSRTPFVCSTGSRRAALAVFLFGSVSAAAAPLLHTSRPKVARHAPLALEWPKFWRGERLLPVPLYSEPRIVRDDFPGVMAQFRVGQSHQSILLRATKEVTRLMHPGELCFRTQGWRVIPAQAWRDEYGHTWNRFRYEKPDGERGIARQAYFTFETAPESEDLHDWLAGAESWPDAAGWYWDNAVAGSAPPLSLSVILCEPAN